MPNTPPIVASTQEHLDIYDIQDDLTITKSGGAALVLQTTAVNFGLLSEAEQDATIFAYAGLLNSLSFPIQIVIRSKKMDISHYLDLLDQVVDRQQNPLLKDQILKYKAFIEATIKENKVLDKRFYIIIPFSPLELGLKGGMSLTASKKPPFPKEYILDRAKTALYPKRDHLIKQLARIGLKAQQLTTQQLVELYYDIYNPATIGLQQLTAATREYATPLVAPAIEAPQRAVSRETNASLTAVSMAAQATLPQKLGTESAPAIPTGALTTQAHEATLRAEAAVSHVDKTSQALQELQQSISAAKTHLGQQQ